MASRTARQTLFVALLLILVACTRSVELISLKDGSLISGTHSPWGQSMVLTLPTGETVRGLSTKLTTADIGADSLFFGTNVGELLGRHTAERVYGYARLTGEQGTVVEIIFTSDWLAHGFGIARTSLREEYRVAF